MARRGRKLTIAWAVEDDAASLYARYRRERRADVRPRLHALWLVRTGHSAREAAGVLGVMAGVMGLLQANEVIKLTTQSRFKSDQANVL